METSENKEKLPPTTPGLSACKKIHVKSDGGKDRTTINKLNPNIMLKLHTGCEFNEGAYAISPIPKIGNTPLKYPR